MNRNRRNIVIAVILLAALLIFPFWPKIQQALAQEDEGGAEASQGTLWLDRDTKNPGAV